MKTLLRELLVAVALRLPGLLDEALQKIRGRGRTAPPAEPRPNPPDVPVEPAPKVSPGAHEES